MTAGAAYDLAQTVGQPSSLNAKPHEARFFHGAIIFATLVVVDLNFLGFNPMRALVWSGIVQGFSVPPLLLILMLLTNDRRVLGERTNSHIINVLGWLATAVSFAATLCLALSWFH